MASGHVFIATSLDGFVARKDHGLDWLMKQPTGASDGGFGAFMDSVDGLVMGAGSFRTVLGFGQWPYEKPVVVMSRSISEEEVPEHLRGKVRISALTPQEIMEDLASDGWRRVYVDGGRLVQAFLREGLIEDLCITQIPVLIGEGIPLFGTLQADIDLELVSAETLDTGALQVRYRLLQT